jgi:uncharacterized membrane protein YoaK (UPF0700 family)
MPGIRDYTNHPKHGPLPLLLLLLTLGTGLVDATSILGLGRVFVANMTGNVVFIGFALAGAPGFSAWGSLVALAGFLVGAAAGGILITRGHAGRGALLRNAMMIQCVLFAVALAVSLLSGGAQQIAAQLLVLAAAALALGVQNAVVRNLAVPDMTTTVLTMTLTGIGSDLRKGDAATALRRSIAVLAMLVGAFVGALLVLRFGVTAGLAATLAVLVVTLIGAAATSRSAAAWQERPAA